MAIPSKKSLSRTLQQCHLYNPELAYRNLHGDFANDHLTLEERLRNLEVGGIPTDTLFFRDLKALLAFEHVILPSYDSAVTIKIASIGCSNGKEPYSLVLRNWGLRDRLAIGAFDVNPDNIEVAIMGGYDIEAHKISGELAQLQDLKIQKTEEAYLLSEARYPWDRHIKFTDEARKRIKFFVLNILKEQLPNQYDVVFLLNFLYHLSQKGRELALSNVNSGMKSGGWLVCESFVPYVYADRQSYIKSMGNIRALGFEKQSIEHFKELSCNYSKDFSQIYRKV